MMPSRPPTADENGAFVSEVARVIKELREEQGIAASELAAKAGIDRSTLERLESRRTNPQVATVDAIAYALEIHSFILIQMAERVTPIPVDMPLRKRSRGLAGRSRPKGCLERDAR